jgi:hypothetical protein
MDNTDYNIPIDYFAKKKIALKEIPSREPKMRTLAIWSRRLAVAASLAILFSTGMYFWTSLPNEESSLNKVSEAALSEFLEDSPYSHYPESYLLETDDIELQEQDRESLFDEEQVYLYLNQYNNEIL